MSRDTHQLNHQIAQLTQQQRHEEAIVLATSVLHFVWEKIGEQSTLFAECLNHLAQLYYTTGQYGQAVSLPEQASVIKRSLLGEQHPDFAGTMNDLAVLYDELGEYRQAELLYQQALVIRRAAVGEQHPGVAQSLHSLGLFYQGRGGCSAIMIATSAALETCR